MRAILVAALVTVAAALFAPAAAQTATPCWQRVLDDWRDGRIDVEHPVHCYRDALSRLPGDLRMYGTAEVDIERALTRALADRAAEAVAPTPAATVRRPQRRALASDSSNPNMRVAAKQENETPQRSFPVKLVGIVGLAALAVASAALAGWRRAVRRGDAQAL